MRVEGEAAELLRWFEGGAMTQLGHEWRTRDGKVESPLGISESADGQLLSPAALEAAFAWFDNGGTAPLLIKSNRLSSVHRRVLLDLGPLTVKGTAAGRLWVEGRVEVDPLDQGVHGEQPGAAAVARDDRGVVADALEQPAVGRTGEGGDGVDDLPFVHDSRKSSG